MNLHSRLLEAEEVGTPVRVGLIGAGKFGSMFLAQARLMPGVHLVGVADLSVDRARAALRRTGWPEERISAASFGAALDGGGTYVGDDSGDLIAFDGIDIVIEATGNPEVGIEHALGCFVASKHVVMVNVEADVVAGPLLARKAAEAGVIYSMAYGDQPALICELVDWARSIGLEVVCAGKGTKYLPIYHESTPDTVWDYYGIDAERAERAGMNAQMFNSFLDGSKSAIEMAAVANACGLGVPRAGLGFPPVGVGELAEKLRPSALGGVLEGGQSVEVVSSMSREGRELPDHIRWGVYVVFEAPNDYVAACFAEYGMRTDRSGLFGALYRPYHLIGLEIGISIAHIAFHRQPTGVPRDFVADVMSVAKTSLKAGQRLDGEGGSMAYGRLGPVAVSLEEGAVPLGLSRGLTLTTDLPKGAVVTWDQVSVESSSQAIALRREMEASFHTADS